MIILYGIKKKLKIDKNLGASTCPNCGYNTEKVQAREKGHFHIYYIPLFAWTGRRGTVCANCGLIDIQNKKTYKSYLK